MMTEATAERVGPALVITLNRPDKLNALTYAMHGTIADFIEQANAQDEIRAVILTGAGRGFCAGTDLTSGFSRISGGAGSELNEADVPPPDKGGALVLKLFECRKPLIAAVNGVAAGMGAALTLAMDYRIGTPNTKYMFPYVRRGIAPESCSTWFLPRLVGIAKALDWMQSGRTIAAQEAADSGLLTQMVAEADLLGEALRVAEAVSDGTSPLAVSLARGMLWQGLVASHPMEAHRHESRGLVYMARSGDPGEGARAFFEKRPPAFQGTISTALEDGFPGWEMPPYS
jgi:enoyl-CoA hydratase/carnithine racemase